MQSQEAVQLLRSVAEQLKMPLATIARQAELGQLTGRMVAADMSAIRTHATAALTLVDSYLLGLRLLRDQTALQLEPVSVSSTLVEAAHELDDFAKQYGAKIELHIAGKYEPVMAHAAGLKSALLALGYALLEGYPVQGGRISLAVHRTPHGIVTGLYGDYERLNTQEWRKALLLQGQASQPFAAIAGNCAGLFVADTIFQAMSTRLRVGKHQNQQGLATTLQPSQQLSFV
jgi:K+-sensing histidine kinase KdpD